MKLITSTGIIAKARRFLSGQGSIENSEEASDPERLAKTLRLMSQRISELEARVGPAAVDFEVNLGTSGALTTILHGFSSPVRWWVVTWTQRPGVAYPTGDPILVQDATSTSERLVLRSYRSGRAIVRVEPATAGIDLGQTVAGAPDDVRIALASNFTTTSVTAVSTGLIFPVKAGEVWRVHYQGQAKDSAIGGLKYSVGAPVGSTMNGWHYGSLGALATRAFFQVSTINTLWAANHTVANVDADDQIIVVVNVAIDGNIDIQVATVTAATTATIYAKSNLVAHRVVEV